MRVLVPTPWKQKMGLAATRTRGLSHVYLGTLSENHTTSWMVVRKSSKAEGLWVELTPQDRAVIAAIDESLA